MDKTVFLFGDATDTWVDGLDQVYKQAASTPWLKVFLEKLTNVVIAEARVSNLDRTLQDSLGHFSTLQELGQRYRHDPDQYGMVQAILLHAVRAATLLQWVKREPGLLGPNSSSEWIGLSGGLLSVAAVAISHDFDSLHEASLEAGRLVLRVAKLASVKSRALEEKPGSWGWAVLGISPDDLRSALEQFQQTNGISKKAKLGVVGNGWSTIIGPPSVLELFLTQSSTVKNLAKNPLTIQAGQHTLDITPADIEYMVGNNTEYLNKKLMWSASQNLWGMDNPAASYATWGDLLRDIVAQVLSRPLDITKVVSQVNSELSRVGANSVRLLQPGTTSHAPYLATILKKAGKQVSVHDHNSLFKPEEVTPGRIAIIGMAGRGPQSDNVDEFWEHIVDKHDLCSEVPKDRFDIDEYYCEAHERGDQRCKMKVRYGCFMENPGHFDSRFFHISPREALLMDPNHRQFLMSSYEALESAGYSDGQTRHVNHNRIASFFAQATDDWHKQTHPSLGCDSYTLQGIQRAFGPGRLAFSYSWEGGTYALDSACAGTTAAIHLASLGLLEKDIDMAVAGAANILSWPHSFTCLDDSGILSPTGNCKTWRDDADGYCRGDFVGAVVLKRLEDAIAHNDNILAVISASGRNHSGNSTSITTSDAAAQERLFQQVMLKANVTPDDISYVEMHGTGTQVGDPAEMGAIANLFKHRRRANGPVPIGGVKANFGHSEAAAGMAELLKSIKMFQTGIVPPQQGMPHPLNPKLPDLKEINVEIPSEPKPFNKPEGKPRRILLNNFDAAGGNACLLLEEYTPTPKSSEAADPRTAHVIASSARTKAAYHANKARLAKWLRENPTVKLEDLAYTTTARRVHHPFRFATSVSSTRELISKLEATDTTSSAAPLHQPVVFVYTGQGSHYAGMGAELYRSSPVFRETVDLAVSVSAGNNFPSFLDIITNAQADLSTKNAVQIQLSVVTLELALTAFWRSIGLEPSIVMGHSLGEYAALYAAGVLSLADTLYLVGSRAQLLLDRCEAGSCSMVSVTASLAAVQERLAKLGPSSSCAVACRNSPSATVVSGTAGDIAKFQADITAQDSKVRARQLSVPYAFHSFQVDPILEDYASLAGGVTFSAPRIPVASTLLGTIVDKPGVFNQEYLARQTRQPVSFVDGLQAVSSKFKDPVWIEVGPGPVCLSFVRQTLSSPASKILHSIDSTASNWTSISKTLSSAYTAGVQVDWLAFHGSYEKHLSLLKLPAYAWDMKDYWVTYTDKNLKLLESAPAVESAVAPYVPPLSTCAQYLVDKSISPSNGQVSVTFRASLCDPAFLALIDNHKMQGVGLCSGSVFCDAALTVAKYALEYSTGNTKEIPARSLSLHDPELLAPLTRSLVGLDGELHTTATLESNGDLVTVTFKAVPHVSSGAAPIDLGSMKVRVRDLESLQREWDRTSYFIKSALDARISSSKSGEGHRLQPEVLYALFAKNVEFGAPFKRIQEGYVSRDYAEAAALVVLEQDPVGSSFTFSPYWGEALAHLAGFMVNGNPEPRDARMTHIVMGFSGVEQTVDFVAGKEYLTYTRISRWEANTAFCDAYVFEKDAGKLVMVCSDLRYQEIPRVVWKNILEGKVTPHGGAPAKRAEEKVPTKQSKTTSAAPAAAPAAAPKKVEAAPAQAQPVQELVDTKVYDAIIDAIVKATGTDPSEFTPETVLSELGVDSIMAIEITSTVRDKTGVDLPATFAFEYPTVGDLRAEFVEGGDDEPAAPEPVVAPPVPTQQQPFTTSVSSSTLSSSTSLIEKDSSEDDTGGGPTDISGASSDSGILVEAPKPKPTAAAPEQDDLPAPATRITLLQGRAKASTKSKTPLYLMADGTGSIATYIHLPIFAGGRPIYGVDSPFLRCPTRLTSAVGIPGVAKIIVQSLLTHNPDPSRNFIIAGFSAGSTIAYEVTRQLAHAGRTVEGLLVIDLCCPRPDQGYLDEETVNKETDVGIKIFSSAAAVDDMWTSTGTTRDHLRVYLSAMRNYHPTPFSPAEAPLSAAVIWAEKGMIKRVRNNTEAVQLLLDSGIPIERYDGFMEDPKNGPFACFIPDKKAPEDLGPNGWDVFMGRPDILCLSMPGADHLDMPMPGHVHVLHERISEVLGFFEGRRGDAGK
ncbi:hypothetical protein QBC37DRAFT_465256 [Rhypophila decipiens]|uniref:Polyketide synthase n=1 Tax=Rhypophila decipiens TaxID=261697 RepID=A0AAN7B6G0_9PEZI|nr:hypothetical protein QBC37DRAFT_465256 [Rhypophila decipiens]